MYSSIALANKWQLQMQLRKGYTQFHKFIELKMCKDCLQF